MGDERIRLSEAQHRIVDDVLEALEGATAYERVLIVMSAVDQTRREEMAWVEQVAAELEMTGHGARDAHNEEVAQAYFDCAAELRARARGER